MMKIVVFMMMGMTVWSVRPGAVTDDEIRDMVVHSGFYIDNGRAAREEFVGAKDLCAGDTNRFAHILCELAQTNHFRIADRMIRCLGRHGTSAQLPFRYSMATNGQHGATAVKSILRLEGVTSNSVAVSRAYLSMTNVDFESGRRLQGIAESGCPTCSDIGNAPAFWAVCFALRKVCEPICDGRG